MAAIRTTSLGCDTVGCERVFEMVGLAADVRHAARVAGWSSSKRRGTDYCPEHRRKAMR